MDRGEKENMTNPQPSPTPLEMLVKLHNQNTEVIKQLRGS